MEQIINGITFEQGKQIMLTGVLPSGMSWDQVHDAMAQFQAQQSAAARSFLWPEEPPWEPIPDQAGHALNMIAASGIDIAQYSSILPVAFQSYLRSADEDNLPIQAEAVGVYRGLVKEFNGPCVFTHLPTPPIWVIGRDFPTFLASWSRPIGGQSTGVTGAVPDYTHRVATIVSKFDYPASVAAMRAQLAKDKAAPSVIAAPVPTAPAVPAVPQFDFQATLTALLALFKQAGITIPSQQ